MAGITALDLFAGTGWGVACQHLGITEHGVEIMPEACASREAAGMSTVFHDVWDGLADESIVPEHDLLIASPPCQTFSAAGKGAGRQALDDVLRLAPVAADPRADLRAAGAGLDDRTALVLTPLAYAVRFQPTFIALEQVPAVLPVWGAVAEELRGRGYSVAVGILNAEQYGVPQTRRRAILVARNDGAEAKLPTPTHSRYYSRDPKRLDEGVLPWVSMAEALGWEPTDSLRSNYGTGGDPAKRGTRTGAQPAPTITSKADRMKRSAWGFTDRPAVTVGNAVGRGLIGGSGAKASVVRSIEAGTFIPSEGDGSNYAAATRITPYEAAILQSYPPFPFQGTKTKQFLQIGNAVPPLLAEHILNELTKETGA